MKIALIGYGKMGKAIEEIAIERGHEIVLKINSHNIQELNSDNIKQADVAIEFSKPESAVENISLCLNNNVPVAVGTTGWYDSYSQIETECLEKNACILTATNFSIGVNIFFELSQRIGELMDGRADYNAEIQEIHHTEKLDSPSGTAITIAEKIIGSDSKYNNWANNTTENKKTLDILSYREPNVPGTHKLNYESSIDKISLTHEAKNRKGFALGAVLASEFIKDKKGIFTMKDVLKN